MLATHIPHWYQHHQPKQQDTWQAQPRQRDFLLRLEDEVLLGGAAGGGKSDALIIWLITRSTDYPGSRGLYLRRTYADLSRAGAALDRSRELLYSIAKYDEQDHRWSFPNRSTIDFGYLDTESDKYRHQSAQYDSIAFDELTQFVEAWYMYMLSRNRATVDGICPLIRAGTNPGGLGHDWVKRRFIDGKQPNTAFDLGEGRTGCFIPARLQDNFILMQRDPGYWHRLLALPEDEREALAYGNWNLFQGQYFKEWREAKHVIAAFDIPATWTHWIAVDYGFAEPYCCLWFARNPDDKHHVYVYRESYGVGLRDEEQARQIVSATHGERIATAVGDPAMFNKRKEQDKPSIAAVYYRNGVKLLPAVNERVAGWQCVRRALAYTEQAKPRLQVLEGKAPNLCRTLPAMLHDPLDSEDMADKIKSTKTEDHAVDALRYGLMLESMPEKQQRKLLSFQVVN